MHGGVSDSQQHIRWGEEGLFRIAMHHFNLGIELECTWATPSLDQSTVGEAGMQGGASAAKPGWMLAKGNAPGGKVLRGHAVEREARVSGKDGGARRVRKGSYTVFENVKKGTFHNYAEPCMHRPKAKGKEGKATIEEVIGDKTDLGDLKRSLREVSAWALRICLPRPAVCVCGIGV